MGNPAAYGLGGTPATPAGSLYGPSWGQDVYPYMDRPGDTYGYAPTDTSVTDWTGDTYGYAPPTIDIPEWDVLPPATGYMPDIGYWG